MPVLRNCNPMGHVDLPLIYREGDNGTYSDPDERGYRERTPNPGSGCLEPGEEFEVTDEQARVLLNQPYNYQPADEAANRIAGEIAEEAEKAALFRQAVAEIQAEIPDPPADVIPEIVPAPVKTTKTKNGEGN